MSRGNGSLSFFSSGFAYLPQIPICQKFCSVTKRHVLKQAFPAATKRMKAWSRPRSHWLVSCIPVCWRQTSGPIRETAELWNRGDYKKQKSQSCRYYLFIKLSTRKQNSAWKSQPSEHNVEVIKLSKHSCQDFDMKTEFDWTGVGPMRPTATLI